MPDKEYVEKEAVMAAVPTKYAAVIRSIPAADVVEVVRCKDCIHREDEAWLTVRGVTRIVAHDVCRGWSGGCATSPDAFCSYGERKADA